MNLQVTLPTFYPVRFSVTISSALVWSNQMVSHKMLDMNISYGLETVFPHSLVVKCVKTFHNLRYFLAWRHNSGQRQLSIVVISQCGKQRMFWTAGKMELKFSIKRKIKHCSDSNLPVELYLSYILLDISGKSGALDQCNFWSTESVAKLISNLWASRHCFHSKLVLFQFRPFLTLLSYLQYQSLQLVYPVIKLN